MIREQITCDACGKTAYMQDKPKGWISVENLPTGCGISVACDIYTASEFSHYCGTSCALKVVAGILENRP